MSNINADSLVLSKENIQPLRHGRDTSQLSAALQAETDSGSRQALEKQRNEFEIRLRSQNSDDPLALWCDYIHWIEQSFPRQPREGKLHSILRKCLNKFKDKECYMNDVRFVKLCIKYADLEENSVELLSQIHHHGIGVTCAELYIAWAEKFAVNNGFKQANLIYEKGIKCQAQPLDILQEAHTNFHSFLARRMLNKEETFQPTFQLDSNERNRQPYNVLKSLNSGLKQVVPSMRTGENVVGSPGKLRMANNEDRKPKSNVGIKIYQESESDVGKTTENQAKISKIHSKKALTKENAQKAGKWTEKCTKEIPFSIGKPQSVGFEVHRDENVEEDAARPLTAASSVLKSHKEKKGYEDENYALAPLYYMEPQDPSVVRMYCKEQVYAGGIEFQFEELRAITYRLKKKSAEVSVAQSIEVATFEPLPVPVSKPEPQSKTKSEKKKVRAESSGGDAKRKVAFNKTKPENSAVKSNPASEDLLPSTDYSMNQTIHTKEALSEMQQLWFSKPASPLLTIKPTNKSAGKSVQKESKPCFNLYVDESCLGNFKNPETIDQPLDLTQKSTSDPDLKSLVGCEKVSECVESKVYVSGRKSGYCVSQVENPERQGVKKKLGFETKITVYCDGPKASEIPSELKPVVKVANPNLTDDEDKENDIPDGYGGPRGKSGRKITGILTPAENVPVAPISDEEEENDEEDQDESFVAIQANTTGITETWNFTKNFKFPRNESTPNPSKSVPNKQNIDDSVFVPYTSEPTGECNNENRHPEEGDDVFLPTTRKLSPRKEDNFGKNLSVIVETSREYKSSSSGSGGASTFGLRSFKNVYTPSEARSSKYSLTPYNTGLQKTKGQSLNGYEASTECSHTGARNSTYLIDKPTAAESKREAIVGKLISFDVETNDLGRVTDKLENLTVNLQKEKLESPASDIDPFCERVINNLLKLVKFPSDIHKKRCHMLDDVKIPVPKVGGCLTLGKDNFEVKKLLGKGSYAKIFKMRNMITGEQLIAKHQKPAFPWEFYITQEVHLRINNPSLAASFMNIHSAFFFDNASVLLTTPVEYGDLLAAVNKMRQANMMCQLLAIYFVVQILEILETLHGCRIIHGDIKPDNFLVMSLNKKPRLQLIDFGRSIDMTLFPEGTSFDRVVTTESFTCIEMKNKRPWTYQTDLYGAANCGHCLLYGDYMEVTNVKGIWNINKNMPRYWARSEWKNFFVTLLNVESCAKMPDLAPLRKAFSDILAGESELEFSINKLTALLNNR